MRLIKCHLAMKRHLSLFLFTLFFSAFCASAAVCAKGQVYEAFETEESFSFELEEEDDERGHSLDDLFSSNGSSSKTGITPQHFPNFFNAILGNPEPAHLVGLYQERSVAVQEHAQTATHNFHRPPFFILFGAFQAEG